MSSDDLWNRDAKSLWKGFTLSEGKTFAQKPQKPAVYTENTEKLAPETERMFNDLLDYCDSIDTEVLFVLSPFSAKEDNVGRLNEAVRIAEERGYPVLNFNTKELVEDVGINWETDFYNSNHANILIWKIIEAILLTRVVTSPMNRMWSLWRKSRINWINKKS